MDFIEKLWSLVIFWEALEYISSETRATFNIKRANDVGKNLLSTWINYQDLNVCVLLRKYLTLFLHILGSKFIKES